MSTNKIMLIGEAWGEKEEETGLPFQGPAGSLLNQMLSQAGIDRKECYVTNVFNLRPQPKNDVENLCGPKTEGIPGFPALKQGKYVHAKYAGELDRLFAEIQREQPNVIVALGASAAWALLGTSGIKKIRGAASVLSGRALAAVGRPIKVVPTYHPAAILREWSLRATTIVDLEKARREAEFPEVRRPRREVWIEPNLADLANFERDFILPSGSLSIDIETAGEQITCVGFAPTIDRCIVVPFVDPIQRDGNYWRTLDEEAQAWYYVRKWCAMTVLPKARHNFKDQPYKRGIGQNFQYDMHRLWRGMGIEVANEDDTMLAHHALQPELEKGLGYMATIYTDELAWKFMRAKHETLKKED
jgi:uracil-DNA glycosylase